MKILLVDDHPIYVDGLSSFLKSNYGDSSVVTAGGFDECIRLFDQTTFDLILIDFKLPKLNGIELVSALIARHTAVPIVVISGEDDAAVAKASLDAGAAAAYAVGIKADLSGYWKSSFG